MARVLLIEDDRDSAELAAAALRAAGHEVAVAGDGVAAREAAARGGHDVLVVDRMLPDTDGLALVRALRAGGDRVPVLIVSALSDVDERVRGLREGGDDYLTKPFATAELLARVEALARRAVPAGPETELTVGALHLDLLARRVTLDGEEVELKPKEFLLLEQLVRHEGQVVTRAMLLESVWGIRFDPGTNVVDVHVSRLRRKVERDGEPPRIETVRGAGYRLVAVEAAT